MTDPTSTAEFFARFDREVTERWKLNGEDRTTEHLAIEHSPGVFIAATRREQRTGYLELQVVDDNTKWLGLHVTVAPPEVGFAREGVYPVLPARVNSSSSSSERVAVHRADARAVELACDYAEALTHERYFALRIQADEQRARDDAELAKRDAERAERHERVTRIWEQLDGSPVRVGLKSRRTPLLGQLRRPKDSSRFELEVPWLRGPVKFRIDELIKLEQKDGNRYREVSIA